MATTSPTTASSLAVALKLKPDALLQAGSGLRLTSTANATALARSVAGSSLEPTAALARAAGLGAGSSRFTPAGGDAALFNTPNLTILSGGGLIDGVVSASADSTGNGPTSSEALASNVGLANLTYLSRTGQPLQIGSAAAPLAAKASARTDALLPPPAPADTALRAIAVVRGLEGNADALPRFYGQPTAVVEASSSLRFDQGGSNTAAAARADAVGLEGYRVLAVPADPTSLGVAAQIGGDATAQLKLTGTPTAFNASELVARAVGIEASTISGTWGRNTVLSGRGLASFSGDLPSSAPVSLLGLGISNSRFNGADGNDTVIGLGGTVGGIGGGSLRDAAGIDRSLIETGDGDDEVYGGLFGDQAGGFDGIRLSTVRTGAGNDLIAGSSSRSLLDGGDGDDLLLLDQSETSSLLGGRGNDALVISGIARGNSLDGGDGHDRLLLADASAESGGNVLDGGYGHDLIEARSGRDLYRQASAGAALEAARAGFDSLLTETGFWAGLDAAQRQELWQSGRLGGEAIVDTFAGFTPGSGGDRLELNSSLAGIRQDLWESDGALYRVNNGALEVIEGRGSEAIGLVVGSLAEIQGLGVGSPTVAYATDTRQLMFDADGDWRSGSISLGSLVVSDPAALRLDNFSFGG
jgi:hypothetical protein